jgi:flavodoxin I
MNKIGIFYGSSTGNTEQAAKKIQELLGSADLKPVSEKSIDVVTQYNVLLFGSSTWGSGELQDDWLSIIDKLSGLNFTGKKIGFFGTGDQDSYPDTFADALGILYEELKNTGAEFIARGPNDDYEYEDSKAEIDNMFVGLVLDEDNQPELSDDRIAEWVSLVKQEIE